MPHFLTPRIALPTFPFEREGFLFEYVAKKGIEQFISVHFEGRRFLLHLKQRPHDIRVGFDKITRPNPVGIIKKALELLAAESDATVLHSNLANLSMRQKQKSAYLKNLRYFVEEFEPDRDVWIEVGFGSGRHLLYQADQNPDVQLIGIEIHTPSIEQTVRRVELMKMSNILIVNADARILCEVLQSNSVGKIFVHFPVPWDKKPHRRVITDAFIRESQRILKPGGTLELRTDSNNYYWNSLTEFDKSNNFCLNIYKNRNNDIESKYEERWKRLEKDIYDVIMTKEASSATISNAYEFSLDPVDFVKLSERFENTTIRGEDYFLHLERLYTITPESGLIRMTLGDYNRPEHRYLHFENGAARYYNQKPIPTRANIKAHERLKGWLDE